MPVIRRVTKGVKRYNELIVVMSLPSRSINTPLLVRVLSMDEATGPSEKVVPKKTEFCKIFSSARIHIQIANRTPLES